MRHFLQYGWGMLETSGPWLILSFMFCGVLHALLRPETLQRSLGNRKLSFIVKATVSGMLLPICSCGVVPLSLGLYYSGAYLGPTLAFLVATPIINPAAVILAYAMLGPQIATIYLLSGFLIPFLIGVVGNALAGSELQSPMAAGMAMEHTGQGETDSSEANALAVPVVMTGLPEMTAAPDKPGPAASKETIVPAGTAAIGLTTRPAAAVGDAVSARPALEGSGDRARGAGPGPSVGPVMTVPAGSAATGLTIGRAAATGGATSVRAGQTGGRTVPRPGAGNGTSVRVHRRGDGTRSAEGGVGAPAGSMTARTGNAVPTVLRTTRGVTKGLVTVR